MKKVTLAMLACAATLSAGVRILDVDVYKNVNAKVRGYDGVSQSFANTADTIKWAEFFVGAANSLGSSYEAQIQSLADHRYLYSGEYRIRSDSGHRFVHVDLRRVNDIPLVRGGQYLLKIAHSEGESINYYLAPGTAYPQGSLQDSAQSGAWDLVARIEGAAADGEGRTASSGHCRSSRSNGD